MHGLNSQPIGRADAAGLFAGLRRAAGVERCVIMLSGGPDSVALTGLAALAAKSGGLAEFVAVTVDHGLRPGSRAEAETAGDFARSIGLRHEILTWAGPKPRAGIQAAAREARYRLVRDFARACGAAALVTAHTLDDQAETVLMRLTHGSGLRGLAAMPGATKDDAIALHRPFLGVAKSRLIATCDAQGWAYASDPSNSNPVYLRARLRRLAPLLAAEGLTTARLGVLANRLRRADEALDRRTQEILAKAARPSGGHDADTIAGEPEEIVVRVFATLLEQARNVDASLPPPRLERIERLAMDFLQAFRSGSAFARTLGGLRFLLQSGLLGHAREPARRPARLRQSAANHRALLGNPAAAP